MNTQWANPAPATDWPTLKANPNCCEEASMHSHNYYIPCNAHAVNLVGWKGRNDAPIKMCFACTDHNVRNRGGEIIKSLDAQPTAANNNNAQTVWPTGSAESLEKPQSSLNPLDAMNEDALLMLWADKKKAIEQAKEAEMDLRKYIVGRAFPAKSEGMNTKELGNGYQLKAAVKYNYNLADNSKVEECLNHISDLGNEGPFIADRLVSWKPSFLLTEYRALCEAKDKGDERAAKILGIVNGMLTITEAAPTLEIKEPKKK